MIKGARYRFRTIGRTRQRLAFRNNKVVEVTSYKKRNGSFVRTHTRRIR